MSTTTPDQDAARERWNEYVDCQVEKALPENRDATRAHFVAQLVAIDAELARRAATR